MLEEFLPGFGIQTVCWLGQVLGYLLRFEMVFPLLREIGVIICSADSHPTSGTDHFGEAFLGLRGAILTSSSVQIPVVSRFGDGSARTRSI